MALLEDGKGYVYDIDGRKRNGSLGGYVLPDERVGNVD
jgi:hypothetical protein